MAIASLLATAGLAVLASAGTPPWAGPAPTPVQADGVRVDFLGAMPEPTSPAELKERAASPPPDYLCGYVTGDIGRCRPAEQEERLTPKQKTRSTVRPFEPASSTPSTAPKRAVFRIPPCLARNTRRVPSTPAVSRMPRRRPPRSMNM